MILSSFVLCLQQRRAHSVARIRRAVSPGRRRTSEAYHAATCQRCLRETRYVHILCLDICCILPALALMVRSPGYDGSCGAKVFGVLAEALQRLKRQQMLQAKRSLSDDEEDNEGDESAAGEAGDRFADEGNASKRQCRRS